MIRFDGNDSFNRSGNTLDYVASSAGTFILVFNKKTDSLHSPYAVRVCDSNLIYFTDIKAANENWFIFGTDDASGKISCNQPAGWDNNWHVFIARADGNYQDMWADGSEMCTSASIYG